MVEVYNRRTINQDSILVNGRQVEIPHHFDQLAKHKQTIWQTNFNEALFQRASLQAFFLVELRNSLKIYLHKCIYIAE